jgi:GNAT superfamily N-acetyltransferase
MTDAHVRPATLDDTQAISGLFRAPIAVWQRINAQGRVEDVPYESLTIYARWLHGGSWMSPETAAIQLGHLLSGAGVALVAEVNGTVAGYAEAYHGFEPNPFGDHLHIAHLITHPDFTNGDVEQALLRGIFEQAATLKAKTVTVSRVGDMAEGAPYGEHYGLQTLCRIRRMSLPARTGQIFYRATEHRNADPAQINGWHMTVGRLTSARQEWEHLWPRTWDIIPEVRAQRTHRLHLAAAGQEAFVCCRQQLYDPRSADISCWSPKPLTNQLVSAIRDWGHREGYRTLLWVVADDTVKTLGAEAEPGGYAVETCALLPLEDAPQA